MKNDEILQVLKEFGLSEHEAMVYHAALSMESVSIMDLARASGVKRTTVYNIVESLMQKGLMKKDESVLKNNFIAEHPNKLKLLLEEKTQALHSLLPDLTAKYTMKDRGNTIERYDGIEAIKNVYREIIERHKPDDFYYVIGSSGKWFKQDPKFFTDYLEKKADIGIQEERYIFVEDPSDSELPDYGMVRKTKYIPMERDLGEEIIITPYICFIHHIEKPYSILLFRNPELIYTYKVIFEELWKRIAEK